MKTTATITWGMALFNVNVSYYMGGLGMTAYLQRSWASVCSILCSLFHTA